MSTMMNERGLSALEKLTEIGDDMSVEYDYDEECEDEEDAEMPTTNMDKDGRLDESQAEWAEVATDESTSNHADDDWSDVNAENIAKPPPESWNLIGESSVSSWSLLTSKTTLKPKGAMDSNSNAAQGGEEERGTDMNSSRSFVNLNHPEEASMTSTFCADESTTSPQEETRPVPDIVLPESALEENKVSCPRCTLANLPGAHICSVCEMPLISNPQLEADYQLALSLAQLENNEGTTDLQSLLSSGTVKPHTAADPSIKIVYQRADAILSAVKSMKDKLQNQGICNVVASIEKEQLIQFLVQLQDVTRGEMPQLAFGYHLSSMPPEEMMTTSSTEDADEDIVRTIPIDSYESPYPSKQLTLCPSKVPDYVWLVLYKPSRKRNIAKEKYTRLLFRNREEDSWQKFISVSRPLVGIYRRDVLPLICTANANFRRPYMARPKPGQDTNSCPRATELAKLYEDAYLELKIAVRDGTI